MRDSGVVSWVAACAASRATDMDLSISLRGRDECRIWMAMQGISRACGGGLGWVAGRCRVFGPRAPKLARSSPARILRTHTHTHTTPKSHRRKLIQESNPRSSPGRDYAEVLLSAPARHPTSGKGRAWIAKVAGDSLSYIII